MSILGHAVKIGDSPFDMFLMELDNLDVSTFNATTDDQLFIEAIKRHLPNIGFPANTPELQAAWIDIIKNSSQIPMFKEKLIKVIIGKEEDYNLKQSLGIKGNWQITFLNGQVVNAQVVDTSKNGRTYYAGIEPGEQITGGGGINQFHDNRPESMGRRQSFGSRSQWIWYYTDFITFMIARVASITKDGKTLFNLRSQ